MNDKPIKTIIILLFLFFILTSVSCFVVDPDDDHVNNTNYTASKTFCYEISVVNQQRVILEGVSGEVMVTGMDGATKVQITGERRVQSDSQNDAEQHLDDLEVRVSDSNKDISIKTVQPQESYGRNYIVDYKIIMPRTMELVLANINGKVDIDSLAANCTVAVVNGNIHLDEINGCVFVSVTNGKIMVDLVLPQNGCCNLNAVNGEIDLSIPKTTSANFTSSVVNGTITIYDLQLKNLTSSRTAVTGILGDGQGTIELCAVNGSINASGK